MIFEWSKVFPFAVIAFGLASHDAAADEQLLDGVRPFICNGEAIVLLETKDGWLLAKDPESKVAATANGWRYEEPLNGEVWYLREESQNSWVIESLSEYGYLKANCIDLADSVSEVVNAIKPRLDEAIVETQEALADATSSLTISSQIAAELRKRLEETEESFAELELRYAEAQKFVTPMLFEDVRQSGIVTNEQTASLLLSALQKMSRPQRNQEIAKSSLGQTGAQIGFVTPAEIMCIRLLRDEGKISNTCRNKLINYLKSYGW